MTDNEYAHLRIKKDTHQKMKIAAAQAGLTIDEYNRYVLNLCKAYPPTL